MSDPATVAPLGSALTPREMAVLRSWWSHRNTPDITAAVAAELDISPNTVRNYAANARSRLGVRHTWEACLLVILDRAA